MSDGFDKHDTTFRSRMRSLSESIVKLRDSSAREAFEHTACTFETVYELLDELHSALLDWSSEVAESMRQR